MVNTDMQDLRTAIANTKNVYMNDSLTELLLDFERVIDELDIYTFDNWMEGELVSGPNIERYWVTCTFMWPHDWMPDPRGGKRLLLYGCKVFYQKTTIKIPVEITKPDDFEPGTKKGRLEERDIWLVKIRMPQEIISNVERGSIEVAGEDFDIEDLQQSMQAGVEGNEQDDELENI